MKTLILTILLILVSNIAYAEIDFVTVKSCRNFIFGKASEGDAQEKINNDLKKELNKVGAKTIYYIKYGEEQSMLRGKDNACIIATCWFSK